jgi:uncharacterized protein
VDISDFVVFLDQIPPDGLVRDLEIPDAESAGFDLALPQEGPLRVHLAISRHGNEVLVRGKVALDVGLECSRCLRSFSTALESELERYLEEAKGCGGDEEGDLTEEEIDIDPLERGVIDLREMIAEQIHLSLPVKPLCEENCRGLCPRCGVDLNKETCSCAVDETDPRWEALKQLKVQ